jgi:hypothetical protein
MLSRVGKHVHRLDDINSPLANDDKLCVCINVFQLVTRYKVLVCEGISMLRVGKGDVGSLRDPRRLRVTSMPSWVMLLLRPISGQLLLSESPDLLDNVVCSARQRYNVPEPVHAD